jgi:SHO1 osmosensor
MTAILVPFAVNGVQFIYQGQDFGSAKGASALKAVGVGWLLLAMVDVSLHDAMTLLSSPAVLKGYLLLSVMQILWVIYLTSEEDSMLYRMFNALGDGGLSVISFSSDRKSCDR